MAVQKIYVDYDFNQNQILNARMHPLTTTERTTLGQSLTTGAAGMLVYDKTVNNLFVWTGTEWQVAAREHYTHVQQQSSSSWLVTHNLNKRPAVSVVDTGDNEVEGDVHYNDNNTLTLTFSAPFSGKAYCN